MHSRWTLGWSANGTQVPSLNKAFICHLQTYESYKSKYPEEAKELDSIITGKLPEGWADGEAAATLCCGIAWYQAPG